jgi:6,7-dimethyl-8-ribityllumazine synthase
MRKTKQNGRGLRIGVVYTSWNPDVVGVLYRRCLDALQDSGVPQKNIISLCVPGAFELPFAAQHLVQKKKVDVVVVLGCLIKGETMHFEYISSSVSNGVQQVALNTSKPVIFGVLCCLNEKQAQVRASKDGKDHGYEWGQSAVEMGALCKTRR